MATCCSQSDRFRRHSCRTMTGRCRSWMRTWQRGNMPILLKTQIERTAQMPIPARRACVGGLCGFCGTAERAYPLSTRKPDVAPTYGSVGEKCSYWQERQWEKPLAANAGTRRNGQDRGILDAAARKQDKAAGSCAPRSGHICPRCGQFRGFTRAFQKAQKSAMGCCRMKKARRFKEYSGVPTKDTR